MIINWKNPYHSPTGNWFKGNLHAHSAQGSPCSVVPLPDLISTYASAGYDFLAISDHMTVTRPESDALTLIPGLEWNSRIGFMPNTAVTYQDHLGFYGCHAGLERCVEHKDRDSVLHAASDNDLFVIANHPNWTKDGHYSFEELLQIGSRIDGVEIFNALIEVEPGDAYALAEWDRLLAEGHRVLGVASDDSHDCKDVGLGWIMVDAPQNTQEDILASLRQGRFYCSSGARILEIGRQDDVVSLTVAEESRLDVVGSGGALLDRQVGTSVSYDFNNSDTSYVRFHVIDTNWGQAWSQPFFRK